MQSRLNLSWMIVSLIGLLLVSNGLTQLALGDINSLSQIRDLPPLFVFSTRINPSFNPTQLTHLIGYATEKFNGCPAEIAIFIHGYNRNGAESGEEFNRIQMSLKSNNSTIPLIGFSWVSDTDWIWAKKNAKDSGIELAKFINEFKKSSCPDTDIRIIAHSLGAATVESALTSLYTNQLSESNSSDFKMIKSVHLLGAAINNNQIEKNSFLGNATEHVVENFYNLFDPEDDGLQFNKWYENGIFNLGLLGVPPENATLKYLPLGLVGVLPEKRPANYNETNVASEIPAISDADGDGNIEECFEEFKQALKEGNNHCGYIGFRNPFSPQLINDGAINVVVEDWKN
jgi:hypothetical protein